MTVIEMHIDIDQKLNMVNSELFSSVEAAEKDWWLNIAMERLIKQRISAKLNSKREGLDATRKRIDDLEELIVEKTLPCFIVDTERTYVVLPSNYLHPLSEQINLDWNCNNVAADLSLIVTSYLSSFAKVPFKLNYKPVGATNFYEELVIRVQTTPGPITTDLFDPLNFPAYTAGVSDADEYFNVLNYMLEHVNENSLGMEVYWEEYKGVSASGNLIIVANNISGITLDNGQFGSSKDNTYFSYNAIVDNQAIYDTSTLTLVNKSAELRIVSGENLRQALRHPFTKTTHESPVGVYRNGKIVIYNNNTFVPLTMDMSYYRKPKTINFAINQSCELNPMVHTEIVDIAVELLSATMLNPNSQSIVQGNLTNE